MTTATWINRLFKRICLPAVLVCMAGSVYHAQGRELELPALPDSLRSPEARASYLVVHFWDALDFAADERASDSLLLEQTFVNQLSVMPFALPEARKEAFANLLAKSLANRQANAFLTALAEKYLYEPSSPMVSDDDYRLFLESLLENPDIDEVRKLRYRAQKQVVDTNPVGAVAADFSFVTGEGQEMTLHSVESPYTLLILFDPECDHCAQVMRQLAEDATVSQLCAAGVLNIVDVYSGEDADLWERFVTELPSGWISGRDDGTLLEDDIYIVRSFPALYLLDGEKRIILKDARPEQCVTALRAGSTINVKCRNAYRGEIFAVERRSNAGIVTERQREMRPRDAEGQ